MLVDGTLVDAETGRTFENVNPATEQVIGDVADGSTADMQRAIARGPAGLRRDRLVDEPRLPRPLPRSSSRTGSSPSATS